MPILVQNIVDQMQSQLDSEGSERYLFDQDFKPAINFAIDLTTAIFNEAFASDKLSPEQLRELTKVRVWQASGYSRIAYDETKTGHPLWTIVAVYPDIKVNKSAISGASGSDKSVSTFRPDVSFIESGKSAKRLSLEQWNENEDNPFMPGNSMLTGGLKDFAYLDFADYSSTSYTGNNGLPEITIRPDVPGKLVAIAYLKTPNKVDVIGDTVEFPASLLNIIVDAALNFVSVKQGDGGPLLQVSDAMVNKLTSLMK